MLSSSPDFSPLIFPYEQEAGNSPSYLFHELKVALILILKSFTPLHTHHGWWSYHRHGGYRPY